MMSFIYLAWGGIFKRSVKRVRKKTGLSISTKCSNSSSSFFLDGLGGKGMGFCTHGSLSLPCFLATKSLLSYLLFLGCGLSRSTAGSISTSLSSSLLFVFVFFFNSFFFFFFFLYFF